MRHADNVVRQKDRVGEQAGGRAPAARAREDIDGRLDADKRRVKPSESNDRSPARRQYRRSRRARG